MSCAPSWTQKEDVPYNIFLFTFGFFLPLLLIIITSGIAVSNIRRSCRNIESSDIKSSALARQYKVVKMVTFINFYCTKTKLFRCQYTFVVCIYVGEETFIDIEINVS